MPANTSPIFALTVRTERAQVSSANPNRDGTGTLTDLITGATNGTKITTICAKIAGNTANAGQVILWTTDTSGANPRILKEMSLVAIAGTTTVASAEAVLFFDDLQIANGQKIQVSVTSLTNPVDVTAFGGDF